MIRIEEFGWYIYAFRLNDGTDFILITLVNDPFAYPWGLCEVILGKEAFNVKGGDKNGPIC
jgi:hypothetical protein